VQFRERTVDRRIHIIFGPVLKMGGSGTCTHLGGQNQRKCDCTILPLLFAPSFPRYVSGALARRMDSLPLCADGRSGCRPGFSPFWINLRMRPARKLRQQAQIPETTMELPKKPRKRMHTGSWPKTAKGPADIPINHRRRTTEATSP
jgi:hypothetical protein